MLPLELSDAIGASMAHAYDTLGVPTLSPDPARGGMGSAAVLRHSQSGRLGEMMLFLVRDCCGGRAELCEPRIASLVPCCPAEPDKVTQ